MWFVNAELLEENTSRGCILLWLSCFYLGELVGDLWRVGVFAGFLFQRNNHKILKEFPLLPLDELQLQRAVAGGPSQDGLQFQQPLGVSWGGKWTLIHLFMYCMYGLFDWDIYNIHRQTELHHVYSICKFATPKTERLVTENGKKEKNIKYRYT